MRLRGSTGHACLYERAGARTEFDALITEIRVTHGQKRNFIALLDGKGW